MREREVGRKERRGDEKGVERESVEGRRDRDSQADRKREGRD